MIDVRQHLELSSGGSRTCCMLLQDFTGVPLLADEASAEPRT